MEQLYDILSGIRPDVDFQSANNLIDGNVLDSFDIIAIVAEIDDAFDVSIDVADLQPENFNSATAMWSLIQSIK